MSSAVTDQFAYISRYDMTSYRADIMVDIVADMRNC